MSAVKSLTDGHRLLVVIMLIAFVIGVAIIASTSPTGIQINSGSGSVSVSHSPASPATGQAVTITAVFAGSVPLSTISIFVDDIFVKSCSVTPCAYTTTYTSPGTHTYYATATDTSGVSLSEVGLISGQYE